jgi:hypothetical protein
MKGRLWKQIDAVKSILLVTMEVSGKEMKPTEA